MSTYHFNKAVHAHANKNRELMFPGLSKWQDVINENAVIALVNPNCGHCTALQPILKEVAQHFKETNLHFINIQIPFGMAQYCTERINDLYPGNQDILEIRGVPKLFLLRSGDMPLEIHDRKYATILKRLTSYYIPNVEKWQDAMGEHAVVAILGGENNLLSETLKALDKQLKPTRLNIKILNTPSIISTPCSDAINALYSHNPIQSPNVPKVYLFKPNYLPIEIHDRSPENIRKMLRLYFRNV